MRRPGSNLVLQVYVFRDGEFIGSDVFVEPEIVIGRDPTVADLVLESTSVSREHALVTVDGTTVHIEDLGSTNGVVVNEVEVQTAEVGRLDEVLIGEFGLKFKLARKGAQAGAESAREPTGSVERHQSRRHPLPRPASDEPEPQEGGRAVARKPRSQTPANMPPAATTEHEAVGARAGQARAEAQQAWADAQPQPRSRPPTGAPPPGAGFAPADRTHLEGHGTAAAAGHAQAHDDDDDHDDEEDFVPPFSLVRRLVEEDVAASNTRRQAVEVVAIQGGTVVGAQLLHPGDSYWVGSKAGRRKNPFAGPRFRLLSVKRGGNGVLQFRSSARAVVARGNKRADLPGTPTRGGATALAQVRPGDIIDIEDGDSAYHIRYVKAPATRESPQLARVPRPLRPLWALLQVFKPSGIGARSMGGSIGTHLVVLIGVALVATGEAPPAVAEEFVEVEIAPEMKLEEAPEPVKPEPTPEKQAAPEKPVPKSLQAAPSKRRPTPGGTSAAPPGVLGLLSKRGSSAAPGPASAVAAVSNLTAARVPGGKGGGFRVSGLIGKLPTSSLSIGGGGGGLVTKGGAALLRGGGGGAGVLAGGTGSRTVGGIVTKVPGGMRSQGQGTLDRDEIQKVINAGISQIQRCYERELLKTPGLAGKIQVEWTVSLSGSVKSVRQVFSDLDNTSAVTCIMGKIKSWTFPKPRGGEVVVTYPFIFKPVGF